ncbi:MAG: hypothetical protein HN352_13215 [Bacteroidetes bacterium]|jgi:signal peptidase I|nr:hypothetical protein [Bacteroidota bacterium]MBT3748086.1 hypothetical protein [Bacteroidota bacterium]MBT4398555.1 hypothetical protein [Bacteroidota bacterium]MBT4411910.1 hypothetical protein [Bacteroidota bacterium]MBT5425728.1 hypothetical protein [Bacteroidota bacterium]
MIRTIIKWGFWILLAGFLLRVFVCQVEKIDSFKMSSSVLPGDRVIIGKLASGSRFPSSILGLPGADKAYLDWFRIPTFRFPGFRKFKNDDVVAFNDPRLADNPIDRKAILISRIAGLPSDTLIIWNKDLYINRILIDPPDACRRIYRVVTDGSDIPLDFLKKHNVERALKIPGVPMWDIHLDTVAYTDLKDKPFVNNIRSMKMYPNDSSLGYWPYSSHHMWNRDQVGPLIVPYAGQVVEINIGNIDRFKDIIEIYENNDLRIDFAGVYINGLQVESYTIKKDYFFLLDDNRDNPVDSRIIGFIPKDHLLGQVKRILYSGKSDFDYLPSFRLKRLLRKIQ